MAAVRASEMGLDEQGGMVRRAAMMAAGVMLLGSAGAQGGLRTLSGTVTDKGHEPLKGAIVQVQDEATGSVVSFLTEGDGTYRFRRLSPLDDYKVWVTYRGHRSKEREMSHFESKADKVIEFSVELD